MSIIVRLDRGGVQGSLFIGLPMDYARTRWKGVKTTVYETGEDLVALATKSLCRSSAGSSVFQFETNKRSWSFSAW